MVEVVPRPRKPNLFVQVFVAVVSGAAAMYCIQNIQPPARPKGAAPVEAAPAPPPKAEPEAPPSEGPTPDADIASNRIPGAPPAVRSMMIAPEPGGASDAIVSVGDDSPPTSPAPAPPPAPIPKPEEVKPSKTVPAPHLQKSTLRSRYVGSIGNGFESDRLAAPQIARPPAKAKPAPRLAAPPPKPEPRFIVAPKALSAGPIPQKDVFVPSLLHPEIVPEKPFWDNDRKRKAVLTGLIALTGFIYLMFVMGVFHPLLTKPKFEEEPPP